MAWRLSSSLKSPPAPGKQDTSLVSVITVTELLRSAQEIIASTYQPLPLYLAAAAVYWVLCQVLEWGQRWYERHLALPTRH